MPTSSSTRSPMDFAETGERLRLLLLALAVVSVTAGALAPPQTIRVVLDNDYAPCAFRSVCVEPYVLHVRISVPYRSGRFPATIADVVSAESGAALAVVVTTLVATAPNGAKEVLKPTGVKLRALAARLRLGSEEEAN